MHFGNFTDIKGISQEFSELIFAELLDITGNHLVFCLFGC
jgi:hypothetical protein